MITAIVCLAIIAAMGWGNSLFWKRMHRIEAVYSKGMNDLNAEILDRCRRDTNRLRAMVLPPGDIDMKRFASANAAEIEQLDAEIAKLLERKWN